MPLSGFALVFPLLPSRFSSGSSQVQFLRRPVKGLSCKKQPSSGFSVKRLSPRRDHRLATSLANSAAPEPNPQFYFISKHLQGEGHLLLQIKQVQRTFCFIPLGLFKSVMNSPACLSSRNSPSQPIPGIPFKIINLNDLNLFLKSK